jgi:hypothetical protein
MMTRQLTSTIRFRAHMIRRTAALCLTGAALLLTAGCFSLDPFLFSGNEVTHYYFDAYTGSRECSDAIDTVKAMENAGTAPRVGDSSIILYRFASGDGVCYGALLTNKKPPFDSLADTVFMYFHGKGPHIDDYWPRTRMLFATGHPAFILDYRGFGMSPGTSSEGSIYEDGRTVMTFLHDSLGNPRVVIYGCSLGSLVACECAANDTYHQMVSLILEAPIGTFNTMVEDGSFLDLPSTYFTTFSGDNTQRIRSVAVPYCWLHGTLDETVDRESQGLPVWNNYQGPKGFYIKAIGGRHITVPQTIGYTRYINALKTFVNGRASAEWPALLALQSSIEWGSKP